MTLERIMEQLENMGVLEKVNDFIAITKKVGECDEKIVTVVTYMLIAKLSPEDDIVTHIINYAFQKIAEEIVAKYNKEN